MSGLSKKKANDPPCVVAPLIMIALLLVLGGAGCAKDRRSYDGSLDPKLSRLVVVNKTSWKNNVFIRAETTDYQVGAYRPVHLKARLDPRDKFAWDLPPGLYTLWSKRLSPPYTERTKTYEAKAGDLRVWRLLNIGDF